MEEIQFDISEIFKDLRSEKATCPNCRGEL
jgi:hypothetical protein